jgi:hypothetical protein
MYRVGDPVIYTVSKHTSRPGQRARRVTPEPQGEFYSYDVDKFWTVAKVDHDGILVMLTRTGKERTVNSDDLRLRHASWW